MTKETSINLTLVFILSILSGVILYSKIQNSQRSYIHTQNISLPLLIVKDNSIIRTDTNMPIQLKGVSTMAFVRYHYSKEELLKRLNLAKSWNINLVGIFINPNTVKGQETLLDAVVAWSKQSKTYIYLIPAIDILDKDHSAASQGEEFKEMMIMVSKRYSRSQNILYGMWAEPRDVPWVAWKSYMNSVGNQIRANSPSSILLITGIQYGRYVNVEDPVPLSNTILDFHDYPWASITEAQKTNMYAPEWLWQDAVHKIPILIGEFGGMYEKDFGSEEDLSYIQSVLTQVQQNSLHYTAYTVDSEGELGLYDWNNNKPTKKGELIIKDLAQYPPTSF